VAWITLVPWSHAPTHPNHLGHQLPERSGTVFGYQVVLRRNTGYTAARRFGVFLRPGPATAELAACLPKADTLVGASALLLPVAVDGTTHMLVCASNISDNMERFVRSVSNGLAKISR